MEIFNIENLSFEYPQGGKKALSDISFKVFGGEFLTVCGKSGGGKTTLLRMLKPNIAPFGKKEGRIYFDQTPVEKLDLKKSASQIGFVMQNPDSQIVCDKVWHELAFGLESIGRPQKEIRAKVSEMASFFGIENWFYKNVNTLSGGQKQLLNLASVMVMNPSVIILDEPTSRLDPIAAQEFLKMLEKINRELGITVIISEHRLEDLFCISDRVMAVEDGKILAFGGPREVCAELKRQNSPVFDSLPASAKIFGALEDSFDYPLSVREGRTWLFEYAKSHVIKKDMFLNGEKKEDLKGKKEVAVELKDVWFRYEKDLPDVLKGLDLKINKGEFFSLLGGNGAGKTTSLSVIACLKRAYRGKIFVGGADVTLSKNPPLGLCMLPQEPQSVFSQKSVYLDLKEVLLRKKLSNEEMKKRISDISKLCRLNGLLERHPFDLSGGEQQRAALAKVLLAEPKVLLLDEPTKGMDESVKKELAQIFEKLKQNGVTIIAVSHDVEFCAEYADRCALFFDGAVTSLGSPREFFSDKNFYTTSTNRMARDFVPKAILPKEVVTACGGSEICFEEKKEPSRNNVELKSFDSLEIAEEKQKKACKKISENKFHILKKTTGILFALLFVLTCTSFMTDYDILNLSKISFLNTEVLQITSILQAAVAIWGLMPQKGNKDFKEKKQSLNSGEKINILAAILYFAAVPLTIYVGAKLFGDRKYYFVSLLIICETFVPFAALFEGKKPSAKKIVVLSVLCAAAVGGRAAFFMLPQFKPTAAVVVISGVCFGGEAGFLVGAVSGFVSNIFFGQGPWTPWQMFGFGIIGFFAGVFFKHGFLKKNRLSLSVFGFFSTLVLYGVIMNVATVIMWQSNINFNMILSSCVMGLPFDLVHAASSAFFLWFISDPMTEKLERIKIKYGI